jgi:gamma-glutamyltranspeptidase
MRRLLVLTAALIVVCALDGRGQQVDDLSPRVWPSGEYARLLAAQNVMRTSAGAATGYGGAVTVAYNGIAARAGLEALAKGGSAIDAALTAAVTQVAATAGAPISYFGIMSLVYYDASTKQVYTMNAEWNTIRGETSPATIPGSINMASPEGLRGTAVSGRTALVGGFMKGVGAAHARFGRLPFARIFDTAIHLADEGMPVTDALAGKFEFRREDLSRLPETRAIFLKADGSTYRAGDTFKQPALASTLRRVAADGTDYIYKGPWAQKLVAAVQRDGGLMTLEDLANYDVQWSAPVHGDIGPYRIYTNPPPNAGGLNLIEAQQMAVASGLARGPHWTESGAALRTALDITQAHSLGYLPDATLRQVLPGVRTAINIDGISIGDPASFQQSQIARVSPGSRLPAPTETGIVFRDGQPWVAFASMGSGLHQRTFQALTNMLHFGMSVEEAVNAADFLMPATDLTNGQLTFRVPAGRFPKHVLDAVGYQYAEVDPSDVRFGGEGLWVAISRDPLTGLLRAASHNRNNSAAFAR